MPLIAQVILSLPLENTYPYVLTEADAPKVQVGVRVVVRLRGRLIVGVVAELTNLPNAKDYTAVLFVVDTQPIVGEQDIALWKWTAQYYMCTLGEVMRTALPSYYKVQVDTALRYQSDWDENACDTLSADALRLLRYVQQKEQVGLAHLKKDFARKPYTAAMMDLISRGAIHSQLVVAHRYEPRMQEVVRFTAIHTRENTLTLYADQRAEQSFLCAYFLLEEEYTERGVPISVLKKKVGTRAAKALEKLIADGVLSLHSAPKLRRQAGSIPTQNFPFSEKSKTLAENMHILLQDKFVLLCDEKNSEIRMQAWAQLALSNLQKGQQVLYIAPEYALKKKQIDRLRAFFGDALLFARTQGNPNEQYEIWNVVRENRPCIVVASRKSVFLPFAHLSLIVIEEEQDDALRQTHAVPYFSAREILIYRAQQQGAKIILCSSTPSLETWYYSEQGTYAYAKSTHEEKHSLPTLSLAAQPFSYGSAKELVGKEVLQKMYDVLAKQGKIFLFQNVLGYAPYLLCETCGWVPICPNCDVALRYFKRKNILQCRYCAHVRAPMSHCERCLSRTLKEKKFGTERVEEYFLTLFSEGALLCIDSQNVDSRAQYETLLSRFASDASPVVAGTSMVLRMVEDETFALVVVLDAGGLFASQDFRAQEKALQLLTRLMRSVKPNGELILQRAGTQYDGLFDFVRRDDYAGFLRHELDVRRQFSYPPFTRLIHILFKHKIENKVAQAAQAYAQLLRAKLPEMENILLGPSAPAVEKIRGEYLQQITLKTPKTKFWAQQGRVRLRTLLQDTQLYEAIKGVTIYFRTD